MDISALLQSVERGRLRTELLSLKIHALGKALFSGQGFLNWSRRGGIRVCVLTDGGEDLAKHFYNQLGNQAFGRLVAPSEYATLEGTTRTGYRVQIERLLLDCFDFHSSNPIVVWRIGEKSIHSPVTFSKDDNFLQRNYTDLLVTGGDCFIWPRRTTTNRQCLQFDCSFGHVEGYKKARGLAKIVVNHREGTDLAKMVKAIILAFSFWASRIVEIVSYDSQNGTSIEKRIMLRPYNRSSREVAPPLGHMPTLDLFAAHEVLLAKAVDFFYQNECDDLDSALNAFFGSDSTSFSTHCLVASAVLEALAKRMMSRPDPVISDDQVAAVSKFLNENAFDDELTRRFKGFMGRLNEHSGANAIGTWAKTGKYGFTKEDAAAWRTLRNPTAHGSFSVFGTRFDNKQQKVAERSRVYNMINKLLLHLIDYRGKYFDYATWKVAELPDNGNPTP